MAIVIASEYSVKTLQLLHCIAAANIEYCVPQCAQDYGYIVPIAPLTYALHITSLESQVGISMHAIIHPQIDHRLYRDYRISQVVAATGSVGLHW